MTFDENVLLACCGLSRSFNACFSEGGLAYIDADITSVFFSLLVRKARQLTNVDYIA